MKRYFGASKTHGLMEKLENMILSSKGFTVCTFVLGNLLKGDHARTHTAHTHTPHTLTHPPRTYHTRTCTRMHCGLA